MDICIYGCAKMYIKQIKKMYFVEHLVSWFNINDIINENLVTNEQKLIHRILAFFSFFFISNKSILLLNVYH